jgi:hypothetical protein
VTLAPDVPFFDAFQELIPQLPILLAEHELAVGFRLQPQISEARTHEQMIGHLDGYHFLLSPRRRDEPMSNALKLVMSG